MSNYPFRTISAATALCLISTTSSAAVFQIGGDLSTLSTTDQNMFDDQIGAIAYQPQDLTIVDTGILPTKVIGEVKQISNKLAVDAYDTAKALYDTAAKARALCNGNPICLSIAPDLPAFPGSRPPSTLKDGTQLTISNVGVKFGLGGEFNVGEGKVSASQEFQSNFTVDKDNFKAGDVLTIGTSADFGTASLSSELGGVDGTIEQIVSLSSTAKLESYVLGAELVNDTFIDLDLNDDRTTIVGFELDDQTVELTGLGQTLPIEVPAGVGYEFRVPFPVPKSPVKVSVADVAVFLPDMDIENATGLSSIGPFDVLTAVETSRKADGDRTGAGLFSPTFSPTGGVLPEDLLKFDVDVDVVTVTKGVALGAQIGVPGVANVSADLLDLDAGGFFSLGQDQRFETKEIFVTLNFSKPTEVETSPGSGIFETVSSKTVVLGTEVEIKHPGGDLEVTPEYSMGTNSYFNRTLMTLSPAITLALGQFDIGGALGLTLPGNLSGFTLFEEVFEPTDTFELGDIFNETFSLSNFDTKLGSAFSLTANPGVAISAVPLPTTLPLLVGGLGLLGALQRRRKH